MNEEPPNPFDTVGDEPVEARIVAWVLGEASAFEVAELERLCEERPELLVFRRRMRALHGLLTESEAAEPDHSWKLPAEKRRLLDEIFGEEKVIRLDPQKEKSIRRGGRRALLGIAACVAVTLFVLRLTPWKHEAEAIIEVKPRAVGTDPFGSASAGRSESMFSQFFGTEFEKIKSRNSLEKVVENLELAERWNVDKESAIKRVKDSIETENVRGTDLISIRVRDADEQKAKEITREVVASYKAYRSELENRETEKGMLELKNAIRAQEDKVEERRKVLATIVRTKGIIYKGQDSFYGQSGVDEDRGARNATEVMNDDTREEAIKRGLDAQDYVDVKREFETDQQLLQSMKLKLINESITQKMTEESIVVHELPPLDSKKSNDDFGLRAGKSDVAFRPEPATSTSTSPAESKQSARQTELVKRAARARVMAEAAPASPAQPEPGIAPASASLPKIAARGYSDGVDQFAPGASGGFAMKSEIAESQTAVPAQSDSSSRFQTRTGERRFGNNIDAVLNNPNRPAEGAATNGPMDDAPPILAGKDQSEPSAQRWASSPPDDSNIAMAKKTGELEGVLPPEAALRIDPDNSAARKGLDLETAAAGDYFRADNDHGRAELLSQVESARELDVPTDNEDAKPQEAGLSMNLPIRLGAGVSIHIYS